MKGWKRPLTVSQARGCEEAKGPRCKCRCGGALHGLSHRLYMKIEREFFQNLENLNGPRVLLEEDIEAFLSCIPGQQLNLLA